MLLQLAAVLCSLTLILAGVVVIFLVINRAKLPPNIPVPDGFVPIFGHLFTIIKHLDITFDHVSALQIKHKGTFCFAVFGTPATIYIQGEANIQHVLEDNFKNYNLGSDRASKLRELFGNGIFTINGTEWRRQRKAASHLFSFRQLNDNMSRIVVDHAHAAKDLLTTHCENGTSVDMQRMFFGLTLDCFALWAFGEDLHSMSKPPESVPFARAFDRTQQLLVYRFFDPFFTVKRFLNIGSEAEIKRGVKILDDFADKTIIQRRNDFEQLSHEKSLEAGASLISWYIRDAKNRGVMLSDEYLRDVMLNFMVAGRDTTACLLSWCVYELTQQPAMEKRVVSEIRAALAEAEAEAETDGDRPSAPVSDTTRSQAAHSQAVYITAAKRMPYLEAFLLETLRLHPSVPSDDRECLSDDTLPDGTKIPKGTLVSFHPYAAGRNPSVWERPLQFDPDRWLEEAPAADGRRKIPKVKKVPFGKFPVFSGGPRVCLGRTLALTEAKLVIAMLLDSFHFHLDPACVVDYLVTITLNLKNGLFCKITPRSRSSA